MGLDVYYRLWMLARMAFIAAIIMLQTAIIAIIARIGIASAKQIRIIPKTASGQRIHAGTSKPNAGIAVCSLTSVIFPPLRDLVGFLEFFQCPIYLPANSPVDSSY